MELVVLSKIKHIFTMNFHGLGEPHSNVGRDEARFWSTEDDFKKFLDAIVEFRSRLERKTEIRITFDDGNKSDLLIGVPALVERGLDATFFVCSDRLRSPVYLSTFDLGEMEAIGMRIGCHGATHVPLRRLDNQRLKAETADARTRLSEALGHRISAFAIPFGSYDRRVMSALKSFDEVHTSDSQASPPGARIVTRHSYMNEWSVEAFQENVANLPTGPKAWLGRTKLLIKRLRP